jgi:hypothetical protein
MFFPSFPEWSTIVNFVYNLQQSTEQENFKAPKIESNSAKADRLRYCPIWGDYRR